MNSGFVRSILALFLALAVTSVAGAQTSFRLVPGLLQGDAPRVFVDELIPAKRFADRFVPTAPVHATGFVSGSRSWAATASVFRGTSANNLNVDPNCDEFWGEDKWTHVGLGLAGTLGLYLVFKTIFKLPKTASYVLAASVATVFGVAREISDSNSEKACFSEQDLFANSVGILAAGIVVAIF